MKLLRFEVKGLDLMKEPIAVDLYARQQVREDDKFLLHHLVSNIYLNTANAFIGINASGKTTLLSLFFQELHPIPKELDGILGHGLHQSHNPSLHLLH